MDAGCAGPSSTLEICSSSSPPIPIVDSIAHCSTPYFTPPQYLMNSDTLLQPPVMQQMVYHLSGRPEVGGPSVNGDPGATNQNDGCCTWDSCRQLSQCLCFCVGAGLAIGGIWPHHHCEMATEIGHVCMELPPTCPIFCAVGSCCLSSCHGGFTCLRHKISSNFAPIVLVFHHDSGKRLEILRKVEQVHIDMTVQLISSSDISISQFQTIECVSHVVIVHDPPMTDAKILVAMFGNCFKDASLMIVYDKDLAFIHGREDDLPQVLRDPLEVESLQKYFRSHGGFRRLTRAWRLLLSGLKPPPQMSQRNQQ